MNILEDLWYGNIQPTDYNTHRIEDHRNLARIYERVETKLTETFTDNQKELLQRLEELGTEMTAIVECGAFMVGFQLGVQLMKAC